MFKQIPIITLVLAVVLSCNSSEKKAPETDVEVATAFIRNILDNKFDEAEKYLLKDTVNIQFFDRFKKYNSNLKKEMLDKYRNADIIVNESSYVTDSIYIFNYSNSVSKEVKNKLKLVRVNGKWLVDLQYTFSGNL